jgi:hypothetical protein
MRPNPIRRLVAAAGRALAAPLCPLFLLGSVANADATDPGGVQVFSPQGEVARVRQVTARFAAQMAEFGDPRAADPFEVACASGSAGPAGVPGRGRWVDGRNWSWDFERDLPVGVECAFRLKSPLRSVEGALLPVQTFRFTTGGPKVLRSVPYAGSGDVREDQAFVLDLNGPARDDSVMRHAGCRVDGATTPARVLAGAERAAALRNAGLKEDAAVPRVVLRCAAPLPPKTRLELVWGKDVAAAGGVASQRDQVLAFTVRDVFTATASCAEHPRRRGCDPANGVSVTFSAPVRRADADRVTLTLGDGSVRKADAERGARDAFVRGLSFAGPVPESASVRVDLPPGLQDDSGRPLANAAAFPRTLAIGEAVPFIALAAGAGVVERGPDAALRLTLRNVEASLPARLLRAGGANGPATDEVLLRWIQRFHREGSRDRERSMLATEADARALAIRTRPAHRPFEAVTVPLTAPGHYVFEAESARTAEADGPRFHRAAVLVTNLAVHFKWGRERSVVWVTTLDRGEPVAGARVAVRDCGGTALWTGETRADGVALVDRNLVERTDCDAVGGFFVTARAGDDVGYVLSHWQQGIEPWRIGVPYRRGGDDIVVHTVFDRTLFRAGETVHLRQFTRRETLTGLAQVSLERDPRLRIEHAGSREKFDVPARWDPHGNGEATWKIPAEAKLGTYAVIVTDPAGRERRSGTFRVEAFRLPTMRGEVVPPDAELVAPGAVSFDLRLAYLSGGGSQQGVKVRSQLRPRTIRFPGYDAFVFGTAPAVRDPGRLLLDGAAVALGVDGTARTTVPGVPRTEHPTELVTEMEFADANGEVQTVAATKPLWPAAVTLGLRAPDWIAQGSAIPVQLVALDTAGRTMPSTRVRIEGSLREVRYERIRPAAGPARWDVRETRRDLGELCTGETDAQGALRCDVRVADDGALTLRAVARDRDGNAAVTTRQLWVTGASGGWARPDVDRVELLADRGQYAPGDTAQLQARAPIGTATALVTLEREGVIDARVERLPGGAGRIDVPLAAAHAPNVYVSVLAVSGRDPGAAPTDVDDPGRPRVSQGVAELRVAPTAFRLDVTARTERDEFRVREVVPVRIRVAQPDGQPLPAGSVVTIAAVDEALLQLAPNTSWDALDALLRRRSLGVQSASAVSQLVARRVPEPQIAENRAMAGLARAAPAAAPAAAARQMADMAQAEPPGKPRELFDTLLKWEARVRLDANGEATVDVPLNDSLSAFRIVAVAVSGAERFGTGDARVRTTQPLQVLSGLPQVVRDGDAIRATATLRNTSKAAMAVAFTAAPAWRVRDVAVAGDAARLQVTLAAGESRTVDWPVRVPADATRADWTLEAVAADGRERDAVRTTQQVLPAVPVRVLQATLAQLSSPYAVKVAPPPEALPGRGGLVVGVAPRLGAALDGVRRYMAGYPYVCLEQKVSKAIALRDRAMWDAVAREMAAHLDDRGFAKYFTTGGSGSDALTAYVLAAAHEAGYPVPPEVRSRMENALQRFVRGEFAVDGWTPRADGNERRLAAIEALSRSAKADAAMLAALAFDPNQAPTSAVLD